MIDKMVNELLDAILEAIHPSMIRREWLERFIRPIVKKYIKEQ